MIISEKEIIFCSRIQYQGAELQSELWAGGKFSWKSPFVRSQTNVSLKTMEEEHSRQTEQHTKRPWYWGWGVGELLGKHKK